MFHPKYSISESADICDDYFADPTYDTVTDIESEDEEFVPKRITKDYIKQQQKKNGNIR